MRLKRLMNSVVLPGLLVALLLSTGACRNRNRAADRLAEDSAAAQQIDNNLTFDNITLEQADEGGRTLWKVIAAQATYSPDQKVAQVRNPRGELYQDGKVIFRIQANSGEVQQDGERIFLRGEIVATDVKSGAILRGDELEWTPKTDVLIVRNNLTGTHPQLTASANEARVVNRRRRMELSGNVIANVKDPSLRLQAERLVWRMDDGLVTTDKPVRIDRLTNNRVTDTATGNQGAVNIKAKVATLTQNAQLDLANPPLRVNSDSLVWNLNEETLVSDKPVTVVQRQQRITLTANQGRMDLKQRIFYATSNVVAVSQRNRSQLTSDRLTWNIPTQQVTAEGNVRYRQANPPLDVQGPRAFGKLDDQTVVVSGGRVETQIIPGRLP